MNLSETTKQELRSAMLMLENPCLAAKITNLIGASTNVKDAMLGVGRASAVFKNAIKLREIGFELLSKLATRIYNTLKASDKNRTDETAKDYVRKIQGRRASAKRTAEEKN